MQQRRRIAQKKRPAKQNFTVWRLLTIASFL